HSLLLLSICCSLHCTSPPLSSPRPPTRRSSDLIVKFAHHGSRFQHEPLYQHLGASVALVPAGRDNPFGPPTDELLEMLDDHGTTAVRTDVHGTVILPAEDPSVPRSVGPAR